MSATSKEKLKKLTPKQSLFVKCYLENGFNGTKACIDAGYSEKTAPSQANENLIKPNIQEAIAKHQEVTANKLNISIESQLEDIQYAKKIARDTLERTEYPLFNEFFRAIEMQNKMLGLNEADKLELQGSLAIQTVVTFGER